MLTKSVAIFLGAVWAYIFFFVFIGPEMSQEERNAEAAISEEFEELRAQGVHLADIGVSRAKMGDKLEKMEMEEERAEHIEGKGVVQRVEEA